MSLNPGCLVLLSVVLCSAPAAAFDPRWARGLDLAWDSVPGETAVNGMSFRIHRATGRDVPLLVQRIAAEWQRESGSEGLQRVQHGDWSVLSRIHRGRSEVAQWRQWNDSAELLWSETDLHHQPVPPNAPGYLMAGCRWMAPVHGSVSGTGYRQSTGYCTSRVAAVSATLEAALQREGWRTHRAPPGLTAERSGGRIEAVISPARLQSGSGDGGTAVVVLETSFPRSRAP